MVILRLFILAVLLCGADLNVAAEEETSGTYQSFIENAELQDVAGNYAAAEDNYRKVLALQKQAVGANDTAVGDTLMHLAMEISNQGRFDEAQELFKAAEPLIQKSVDPIDDARLTSYLALDAANRHSFAEARDLSRRATKARRDIIDLVGSSNIAAGSKNAPSTINADLAQGEIAQSRLIEAAMCLRLGELAPAGEAASDALEIIQTQPGLPHWWKADALGMMGQIEGRLGKVQSGEKMLNEALAINQQLFGEARPTALAWLDLGRFHAEQGRYEDALKDFRQGLAILERLNLNEGQLSFDTALPYFVTTMQLAESDPTRRDQLLGELFAVLQDVQKGKESSISSRSLMRLTESDPRALSLIRYLQDAERNRDQMRLALAAEANKPLEARDAEREHWLADQFHASVTQMERLNAALAQGFAEYRQSSGRGWIPLKAFQSLMRPGEVFVSYAFGDNSGLVLAISANSINVRQLKISASELAETIGELRGGVIVRDGRVGNYDLKLAYRLYRVLLSPIQDDLDQANRLFVATSGALASLPLSALVTQDPANDNPAQAQWLIKRLAISQMPSASAFAALRRQVTESKATRPFIGIGNPQFTGNTKGMFSALSRCGDDNPISPEILAALPPLPDTADEIRMVARTVGANDEDILLGAAATEKGLKSHPLDQYRILYFATHGLLPSELRCQAEPALALTPPPQPAQTKDEDGLLEAGEIARLKLDADLVVLSACNTATVGGKFGGETLASLSDMFFYAGSRAVLATHWPVPSASTSRLMARLFQYHAANSLDGYAMALQQAQISLLTTPETSHPIHWAGFSLIGGTGNAAPRLAPGAPQ